MTTLKQKIMGVGIGLASLTGCDARTDISLTKGKIENIEVRYVKNIMPGGQDQNTIEIYDSNGHLRAELKSPIRGFIQYDDHKVAFEFGDVVNTSESINQK